MRLQALLTVWGARYTEFFLKIVLPSLCTSGNLLGFARYEAELDIYTTPDSQAMLNQSPQLQALSGYIDVRLNVAPVDPAQITTPGQKYELMASMHRAAVTRSAQTGSVMFFLAPDAIFADGSLMNALARIQAGKRAVMMAAQRVSSAGFLAEALPKYNPRSKFGMVITPRELTDLFLRHPHEQIASFQWGAVPYTEWPSQIFFPVADEGMVVRAFHAHTLAVYPQVRNAIPAGTHDGFWLEQAIPNFEDWYIVQDSDEGFGVDVATSPDQRLPAHVYPDPVDHVARWALEKTDSHHRWIAGHTIRLHRGRSSPEWVTVESRAQQVLDEILERIALYSQPPAPATVT